MPNKKVPGIWAIVIAVEALGKYSAIFEHMHSKAKDCSPAFFFCWACWPMLRGKIASELASQGHSNTGSMAF